MVPLPTHEPWIVPILIVELDRNSSKVIPAAMIISIKVGTSTAIHRSFPTTWFGDAWYLRMR